MTPGSAEDGRNVRDSQIVNSTALSYNRRMQRVGARLVPRILKEEGKEMIVLCSRELLHHVE